jgi:ATP-binding cassette, subfamily B, bacterial
MKIEPNEPTPAGDTRIAPPSGVRGLRLTDLLRPYWRPLSIGIFAVIGETVANLLEPWPLKVVLDNVVRSRDSSGWLSEWLVSITDDNRLQILTIAAVASIVIAAFGASCSYGEKYVTVSVGQGVMHGLRRTLYAHIQRLSLSFHDRSQTGDLISRVTSDIDSIQSFIVSGFLSALINCLTLAGIVGVMFYLNWRFTLIALSVAPVLFAVVFFFTRRIKKASREAKKKEGEIASVIQEVLSSIRVVKAFAREEYEERRLEEESLESVEIAMRARTLKGLLLFLVDIIVALGTTLVLWFGARMVLEGDLSSGSLVLFIFYLGKMYKPMQELSKMTDSYAKATAGYERIGEILETDREVKDAPRARQAPAFRGHIEFDNVSFGYNPEEPLLRNVNFAIEPGQIAAFVGPTGAGKTTIMSLIPRFYDPTSGVIRIDGHDIRLFTQRSLRERMSFVLQETLLFHAPVWTNIAYGKPDAKRNEVLRAAETANAHEFIEKMPGGYDTMVGERGATLSGGQRQRIAIARAVIRNTPILLLDEASSALDAASEQLVFEALDRLMEGKTCIVIAHRLSTIRRADMIFVIKDGTIAESGKHEDLLKAKGLYAELHELQSHQAEDAVSTEKGEG